MFRYRRAVTVALTCIILGLVAAAASAATGAWSAVQVDHTGQHQNRSYIISCPSSALCVGADYGPVVFHVPSAGAPGAVNSYDLTIPYGSGDNGVTLDSLQCPSTTECLGVADFNSDEEDDYSLLGTADPNAGANAWRDTGLPQGQVPTDLSCPSASFCVGSTGAGAEVSQDPLGGRSAWTQVTIGTEGLTAVTCPSTGFCVGFDADGDVWTSTEPTTTTSAAWTQSPGGAVFAKAVKLEYYSDFVDEIPDIISCGGPTTCVAIDATNGTVLTSTNPAAGTWTPVTVSTAAIGAVHCLTGTTTCLAGDAAGKLFMSSDGGATWSGPVASTTEGIQDISCSASVCAAVGSGEGGDVDGTQPLFAQIPAAGAAWNWVTLGGLSDNALSWIACPTTKGCLGSDESHYFASANPAKGAKSWTSRTVTLAGRNNDIATQNGSCYSPTGCLLATLDPANGLADVSGGELVRFDPAGGAHGFADTHVGRDDGVRYVTCAQGTCVAGYPGNWYQSSHPALNSGWQKVAAPRFDVTCLSGNASCVALAAAPFGDTGGPNLLVAAKRGGPWKSETIDPGQLITGLACTSAKTCVVVDAGGQLLVSAHPTAGVSSWTVAAADENGLSGVACQTARTCVAVDGDGGVVIGHP